MNTLVKVCGMTRLDNFEEIAQYHPDYFGLIFVTSSPRYYGSVQSARGICSICKTGKLVAVVHDPTEALLVEICEAKIFSAIQLHGANFGGHAEFIRTQDDTIQVWRALSFENSIDECTLLKRTSTSNLVDRFVFDGATPGRGTPFNWERLKQYSMDTPYFVAGGIGPENLGALLDCIGSDKRFIGIDINSRVECAPGIKNPALVEQIITEVKKRR